MKTRWWQKLRLGFVCTYPDIKSNTWVWFGVPSSWGKWARTRFYGSINPQYKWVGDRYEEGIIGYRLEIHVFGAKSLSLTVK